MSVEIQLSNGETVRVHAVSPYTLAAAEATVRLPEPPTVTTHIGPEDGGHDETHPDTDPKSPQYQQYLVDREKAERLRDQAANNASLLFGLRDVALPADDEWIADLAYAGIVVGDDPRERRLAYIKYVLLQSDEDIDRVFDSISSQSYARAKKAANLEASFRRSDDGQGQAAAGGRSAHEVGTGLNGAGSGRTAGSREGVGQSAE